MAKVISIPDVGDIEFPDSMTDADIAKAAKSAHDGAQFDKRSQTSGIKPEDTLMPGANKWLKENHPNVYSAIEGLMTAIPRGADQITRGVFRPGSKPAERVADVIEGTATAASPALLAVPGMGTRAVVNTATGLAGGLAAQGLAGKAADMVGAAPETSRAVGDVAGLVGGVAAGAGGAKLIESAPALLRKAGTAVADVATTPGVIKGLKRSTEGVIVGSAMHGNVPGVVGGVAGRIAAGALEDVAARRAAGKVKLAESVPVEAAPVLVDAKGQPIPSLDELAQGTFKGKPYDKLNVEQKAWVDKLKASLDKTAVAPAAATQTAPVAPEVAPMPDKVSTPPTAPPIGADYVMPEPQPAGAPAPNVGQPRFAPGQAMPPQSFPQPEAPPAQQPAVIPPVAPTVASASPSSALGAFGVDEPLVFNRARVKALAKDNGIAEVDQLKMLRDQGYTIQDDPFATGKYSQNRRGKVTSPEPMKPETKAAASEREPWQLKQSEIVPYKDTRSTPSYKPETEGGYSEAEMHERTLRNRASEQTPPTFKQYPVGTWAKDSGGELMQLREYKLDDPRLIFPEGKTSPRNATVQKYADWINEGSAPPPASALETDKGSIRISEGHHRAAAIEATGGKTIKAWVSVTKNRPLGNGEVMPEGVTHAKAIQQAISEGKAVPSEVLADYPEIKPDAPSKQSTAAETEAAIRQQKMTELGKVLTGESEAVAAAKTPTDKWFGKSKVATPEGEPLVVYHGTTHDVAGDFKHGINKTDEGYLGKAFYFGDAKTANIYAGTPSLNKYGEQYNPKATQLTGGNVLPVYLKMENPLKVTAEFTERSRGPAIETDRAITVKKALGLDAKATSQDVTDAAKKQGYDGVIYDYRGSKEYAVFDPANIKSSVGLSKAELGKLPAKKAVEYFRKQKQ